jgi:hypothetical protein
MVFALRPPRLRMVEPIVVSTFGPRVGHEMLSGVTNAPYSTVGDGCPSSFVARAPPYDEFRSAACVERHDLHQLLAKTDTRPDPSPPDPFRYVREYVRPYCDTPALPERQVEAQYRRGRPRSSEAAVRRLVVRLTRGPRKRLRKEQSRYDRTRPIDQGRARKRWRDASPALAAVAGCRLCDSGSAPSPPTRGGGVGCRRMT